MIDARALTWTALFPADAGYMWHDLPEPFQELLELAGLRDGKDVLCLWSPDADDLSRADIQRFGALALLNPRGVSQSALREAGFTHTRRYAIAPRLADARWFVPRENTGVTAAVLGGYAPYRLSARLKKTVAQAALRMRFPRWHSDEILVASRTVSALERVLAEPFAGEDVRLAFSTGTPGPSRKPVAHVVNLKGRVLGYAKLGVTDAAARLVRREGELLGSLAADARSANHVPKLLFQGEIEGIPAILVDPVDGQPGQRKAGGPQARFLTALRGQNSQPVTASAMFRSVDRRFHAAGSELPQPAHAVLEAARPVLEESDAPVHDHARRLRALERASPGRSSARLRLGGRRDGRGPADGRTAPRTAGGLFAGKLVGAAGVCLPALRAVSQ